jgi:antitoxin HicB
MSEQKQKLDYYLSLNYPVTLYRDQEGGYVAEIEDLPGCITEGENLDETMEAIENARHAWLETAIEDGNEIPCPRNDAQYSGKFIARIPKYLHRQLAEQAKKEGVSLNQYVETILSQGSIVNELHSCVKELKTEFQRQNQYYKIEQTVSLRSESFISSWTGKTSGEKQILKENIRTESERVAA